jgi:hypothetical protein
MLDIRIPLTNPVSVMSPGSIGVPVFRYGKSDA